MGGYRTLVAHKFTTLADTLVFFLIVSLVPFLFWLTLLFGTSALDAASLSGLGLFDWAEDLLVFFKENAAENTAGVMLFFAAAGAILFVAGVASRFLPPWISYPVWYLLALLLGFFAAWILNTYLCPYKCRPSDTALGSFLTAIAWLVASGAFAIYLNFGNKEQLYGALTLVVVFLIWLYWMMICLTAGAVFCRVRMGEKKEHKEL